MIYNSSRALELLRIATGLPDAVFREGQQEAIRYVVEGRGRLLGVQKTGWGKGLVYFIATQLLREATVRNQAPRSNIFVPDFAHRLAARLGLPFLHALTKNDERAEQKTMENSTQQARNIDGSLAVSKTAIRSGSVLLIDDMVDSRWTMTVAAWLLRAHGSGEVFPLALAYAGRASSNNQ